MRKILFIFGQLTDEDVDWFARNGRVEKLDVGVKIIERGKDVENIYIVLDGSFSVLYTDDPSNVAARLQSGEMVGEMSFIDASPPSATVVSDANSRVLRIAKAELQTKLKEDSGFAARFYRSTSILLSDRLRSLARRLAQIQGHSLPQSGDELLEDELDLNVLDGVSLAGNRFERMLKQLIK